MSDPELEAIKAQRLAQMKSGGGQGQQSQEEQRQRLPELAVSAVCPHGSLLVNSIAMVKPEKAQMVENMLISMFQSGKLQGQVEEDQLRGLLERVSEQTQKKPTINFRRRNDSDSD